MILVAYRHGLRVSELVALRWSQLDFDAGRIRIIRRKGSENSIHPLRTQPTGTSFVFISEREAPMSTRGFALMLERAAHSIGMTDVHPHLLRHGCGFKLVNDGVDTRSIAAYLGHKNMANTARYTRMSSRRFDDFWKD